ncbi:xylulokinase [Breznakiella homolactica]|nr:FGGY-family carbohydrate kinase [Breznakiella homolactica]
MIKTIDEGPTFLGIELGSTRIKSVLIGEDHHPLASGSHDWENRFEDGLWTYHIEDVHAGIQESFGAVRNDVLSQYGTPLASPDALGVSAMMHGYLAFDKEGRLLAPFRTWRNTTTEQAAAELTDLFGFNIPHRWSIAHVYQAILNGESHVRDIAFITSLAGYVHWRLTGKKVLGIGDASGVLPVDSVTKNYDTVMAEKFNKLIEAKRIPWKVEDILPEVLNAGEEAGRLTPEGAALLDPSGSLSPGIPFCPPEGDAETGMVATNSVAERTGNISAGTSIFAMVVLEKPLSRVYPEIDIVTTPTGKPVAMAHCNNCTTDLDAWIKLFQEIIGLSGARISKSDLYDILYGQALKGEPSCGGLLSYNYYSGEPITGLAEGRPLFVRTPDSRFTLANTMRSLLFSAMATLKIGMDILTQKEQVKLDRLLGHGGLFKTKTVGQRLMAAALNVPVAVMDSAAEGGAWGIAVLAAYMMQKQPGESLESYLTDKVFSGNTGSRIEPDPADVSGFESYMKRYAAGLSVERAAAEYII